MSRREKVERYKKEKAKSETGDEKAAYHECDAEMCPLACGACACWSRLDIRRMILNTDQEAGSSGCKL